MTLEFIIMLQRLGISGRKVFKFGTSSNIENKNTPKALLVVLSKIIINFHCVVVPV